MQNIETIMSGEESFPALGEENPADVIKEKKKKQKGKTMSLDVFNAAPKASWADDDAGGDFRSNAASDREYPPLVSVHSP